MKTIAVTGGSGKLGAEVIRQLKARGYGVVSLDNRISRSLPCRQIRVDLNDLGEVASALRGVDAIVHLAAIPAPLGYPHNHIFTNNVISGFNILEAASLLGIQRVVMSSSTSCYGFAWAESNLAPVYLPVDEEHPQLSEEGYGLSKTLNELTAAMFSRRSGLQVISLRFSLIATLEEYRGLMDGIRRPEAFKRILWSYIDIRDAASACIAALETQKVEGAVTLNVTGDDTLSEIDTEGLIADFYPEVTDLKRSFKGREPLFSNEKAKLLLGWTPQYTWANGEES